MGQAHRLAGGGFTLLELLLVLAVLAVLASVVLTSSAPTIGEQLQKTADLVAGDLAQVRSLAVANATTYRLTFVTVENEYWLEHAGANAALDALPPNPFRDPSSTPTRQVVALDELVSLGADVRLYGVDGRESAGRKVLEFGPLGETTNSSETTIWLVAGRRTARRFISLSIDPVTGIAWVGELTGRPPLSIVPIAVELDLQEPIVEVVTP